MILKGKKPLMYLMKIGKALNTKAFPFYMITLVPVTFDTGSLTEVCKTAKVFLKNVRTICPAVLEVFPLA